MSSVHVHPRAYVCRINESQKANSLIWENKSYKLKKAIVKFLFLFVFFFGVRYWNVGRNHTHTHTKKSESWHGTHAIYNYIKIKYYFLSFLLSFSLFWNVTKNKPNFLHTAWWYNTSINNNAFINSYLFLSIYLFSCYVRDFLKWNQKLLMKLITCLWIRRKENLLWTFESLLLRTNFQMHNCD